MRCSLRHPVGGRLQGGLLQSSKHQILTCLKRQGSSTVDGLAQALGLAPVTVRQHLTGLQRDDLVETAIVRRSTGRPHYSYRLSRRGEDTFPRRYDRLTETLLQEISVMDVGELAGLGPEQRMSLLLRRLSHRLALHYAPQVQNRPLEERVAAATEILHADGGFAEWEQTSGGYEIRDFNCLFHRLLDGDGEGELCEWHRSFLSRMLGTDVRVVPCSDSSTRCCRYLIETVASERPARPMEVAS